MPYYITIILAIFTSLLIPFLFKVIDFHIGNNSRLNERLKSTQLYYELKSKQTTFIELERAAQAMVNNRNATVNLVETFVELCLLDHDCRELNQDIDIVVSAKKYLTFDITQELKNRIVFIEKLSSKSQRVKLKLKKSIYCVLCVTIGCIPFIYRGQMLNTITHEQIWTFYFGSQLNAVLFYFYSFVIAATGFIFALRHQNDIYNLGDAEKLLKRIQEKFVSSNFEAQVTKPEETQAIAS